METNNKKDRVVRAIENGTVIDHIPADALFKVIQILGLSKLSNQMTFGVNLTSQRLGKKGIIKIADKFFKPEEINRIALVAPHAKLNIIRNFEVVEKLEVRLPEKITGIVRCVNPKCITNNDQVEPQFEVLSDNPVSLRCHYCERITDQSHMEYITE
jgi:aspartate carbamoyltransferase, regulatory subunit